MANTFTMIEETETRIIRSIRWIKRTIRRSWTIRTLKHEYGVIVITLLGVALALGCLYTFVKAEQWILKEKIVTVSPWNYVRGIRTAQAAEVTQNEIAKMTTEEYIAYKFGKDARMALAISQAENGTRKCDRITIEPNNTVSVGLFQINTVHFNKYQLKQLITCQGNIDAAKQIYDSWGSWSAWSVYKNGSYKKFLQ